MTSVYSTFEYQRLIQLLGLAVFLILKPSCLWSASESFFYASIPHSSFNRSLIGLDSPSVIIQVTLDEQI